MRRALEGKHFLSRQLRDDQFRDERTPAWEDGRCGRKAAGTGNSSVPRLLGTGLALRCWPVTPSSRLRILSKSCLHPVTQLPPPPSVHTTQRLREFCQHRRKLAGCFRKLTRKSERSGAELCRAGRCQVGKGLTNGCCVEWPLVSGGLSCFVV